MMILENACTIVEIEKAPATRALDQSNSSVSGLINTPKETLGPNITTWRIKIMNTIIYP
jgi:hypothetical protein